MKFRITSAIPALLAIVSLSSCHNDDFDSDGENKLPVYYFQAGAKTNFIAVQDITDGAWRTYQGTEQMIVFNMNTNTCTLSFESLKYNSSDGVPFTLADIPLRTYTDPNVKGAEHSDPLSTSGSSVNLQVTNFKITALLDPNRTFGLDEDGKPDLAGPQIFISFIIDGRYKVRVIQNKNYFYGTTSSINPSGDFQPFTTQASKYELALNYTTGKAQLTIENAQFVTGMPQGITMEFPGIDFTITDSGIDLACSELIPQIPNRGPFPAYKVTNLSGNVPTGERLNLNFTCPTVPIPMNGPTYSFTVTVNAPYSLTGGL